MPGQQGTERRRMPHAATVRMDNDLFHRARAAALMNDVSVAEWLRRLAMQAAGMENAAMLKSPPRTVKPKASRTLRQLVELSEGLAQFHATLSERSDCFAVAPKHCLLAADDKVAELIAQVRAASAAVILAIERMRL